MNFLKKFFSSAKKNKETIIFFIIHIMIFVFSFFCTSFINDKIKIDIEKIFLYVLDLIYLLITILLSLQFIIKQIYINRMSSKYVSRQFNFKIIYKVCVLLIMVVLCFINSYVDYNEEIIVFILLSIIYFFIYIFVDMKNIELERHINKKIVELIEDIKENDNPSKELDKMYKLYRDCYEKKEINLAIKVVNAYVDFLTEDLCKLKEYLLRSEEKNEREGDFQISLFYFMNQMLTNETNASSYRVDNEIFITMAKLMNKCYKSNDEKLIEFVEFKFKKMCLEKGNNFKNETFRNIIRVLLKKCSDKKEYMGKLNFLINMYNDMIEKNNFDEYFIVLDYLLFEISEGKHNKYIYDREIIEIYLEYAYRTMFYQKNILALLQRIGYIETTFQNKEIYDELLRFYKRISECSPILENETVLILWIEYFVKLMRNRSDDSKKEYCCIIFDLLSIGAKKTDIVIPVLFDWINYEILEENKEKIMRTLFVAIKYNSYGYLTLFLDRINEMLIDTNDKSKKPQQINLFEIYELLLVFSLKQKNWQSLNFIVDSYKEVVEKMDKENIISQDLFKHIINQVEQVSELFIEYNGSYAVKILSILEEMTNEKNKYRILQDHNNIIMICDKYFKLAFAAAERSVDEVIRFVSNQIGWNIKTLIDKNLFEEGQKLFAKGYSIFEMLVKIDYNSNIINFVATFVVTMGAYCFAKNSSNSIGNHIISKIRKEHLDYIKNALVLRDPVKKAWNISMSCENYEDGFIEFKKKVNDLVL